MARINLTIPAVEKEDGTSVDLTARPTGGNGGQAFSIIEPKEYFAVVKELTQATKEGGYTKGGKPFNPPGKKGQKWTYLKLTPSLEFLNDNKTLINRQELTVGIVFEGGLYRPEQDGKSAMWPEAQYLLNALGLISLAGEEPTEGFKMDFDPAHIKSRVVKVKTAIAGYRKGVDNFKPAELYQLLSDFNGGDYKWDETVALAERYNEENGLTGQDDALKLKNVVTNFFPVDAPVAEEREWFVDYDSGAVYLSEFDFNVYLDHLANPDAEEEQPF